MKVSEVIAEQLNGTINKKTWENIVYNVKAYGAIGDGVTNDSAAFASAVAVLKTAGGGILRIPPGKYVLTTPITITDTDIVIEGSGIQLTQLFFTGSNGIVYSNTNPFSDCIQIRDLSVVTITDNLYTGIDISFPSNNGSSWRNALIENVMIAGTTSISAYNDGSNNSQTGPQNWVNYLHLNNCAVTVVRDCVFRASDPNTPTSGNGIFLEGYTVDILIQGCKMVNLDVGIKKSGPGEGIVIDNCVFIQNDYPIYLNQGAVAQAGVYASIQNCHMSYYSSGIIAVWQPQITVQNCLIYDLSTVSGGSDIVLDHCDKSKIISNTMLVNIGAGLSNGISISNSTGCVIDDNIIEERGTGIWLQSTASNNRLYGNKVTGNTTNYLDQGTGNYRQKLILNFSSVITPSGTSYNADIALPSGILSTKPTTGFMMSASTTEDILGFYDFDSVSSTATNARFRLVKKDGTAFAGVATRFNIVVYE